MAFGVDPGAFRSIPKRETFGLFTGCDSMALFVVCKGKLRQQRDQPQINFFRFCLI